MAYALVGGAAVQWLDDSRWHDMFKVLRNERLVR